ncbi:MULTISPECIES: hypothetical protein [unclassified Haladaptatus]|uniref:DUF7344 domain-containing protein n=1 Tax=unclassified Haladaptatus TaxID=2622732 RepID=UPI00209BE17D|nr:MULTISPECIES: hypothetical protein [unclassified Haladaptatus]MCO8245746.1 hypothetical protein [Haladaptatus sp. AB643]MCO8256091.1 hypothetical protein [Haladaptatus sp. AB618]
MSKPQSQNTGNCATIERSSLTDIFRLLSDDRRRRILHAIRARSGPMQIGALVAELVKLEGVDSRDRIELSLYHNHLPRLSDSGIIDYTPGEDHVVIRKLPEPLVSHLLLAEEVDGIRQRR